MLDFTIETRKSTVSKRKRYTGATDMIDKIKQARENSKKRKFNQTFDLIINLRALDLKKPENRINSEFVLPAGKGKEPKVGIFADVLGEKARAEKIDLIITKAELNTLAGDKKKMKKYANQVDFFFGEAPLMPFIGKTLGTILGPRDKVPKPIPPTADLKPFLMATKKTIKIRIRESPVIQVAVGTEEMKDDDIAKNSDAVLNFVRDKMPKGRTNIKNAYIKLTMGKPIKLDLTQLK